MTYDTVTSISTTRFDIYKLNIWSMSVAKLRYDFQREQLYS
jgi:hypothetical protein